MAAHGSNEPGFAARERNASDSGGLPASVAHEINNPLDSILSLLYLLRDEVKTEHGRHSLMLIEQEVGRVARIAREGMGIVRDRATLETTRIAELVKSVLEVYATRLEAKHIRLSTRFDGACIPAFSGQLRQLISNLLLNALDALSEGGKLIVRTAAAHEWTGQQRRGVRLTIADNGCGIPVKNLARILQRFFTTKGQGGSGLGLPLVKDIVQRHNGTLRVRSSTRNNRSGTVFTVFLPAGTNLVLMR